MGHCEHAFEVTVTEESLEKSGFNGELPKAILNWKSSKVKPH